MRLQKLLRNLIFLTVSLLLFLAFSQQPASAQMDWLKAGKDLLGAATNSKQGVTSSPASSLSDGDITSGLKDALRVGTETVVGQLGKIDGFNSDQAIHIPLPENMQKVKSALAAVGMSAMMDDLELKLNRAAEEATPPAKELFWSSIEEMSLEDVQTIYKGPEDSATRYFQGKMSDPLAKAMAPIVERALSQVGAVQAYDNVMGQYAALPFMPDVKANLNSHVVDKGMEGIFHYLAKEEAAIRQNPLKRTTDILQKVFGAM